MTSTQNCPLDHEAFPYPMARETPFDPPPVLDRLRTEEPVARVQIWDGSTPWLLTRHADVRLVLSDPRFSADDRRPGFPAPNLGVKIRRKSSRTFNQMDGTEHSHYRTMLTAEFTVRNMERYRAMLEQTVAEMLDGLAGSGDAADLVETFALPLPSLMICHLLGVDYTSHDFFQEHSKRLLDSRSDLAVAADSGAKLLAFLEELVDIQTREPGDNLFGRLVTARVRTGELTPTEAASMGIILLVGGHETTANMLALSVLSLLLHPEQAARMRDGDAPTVKRAVEELLRYHTIAHKGLRRVAIEDVEIGGVLIRAGDGIIASLDSANRDELTMPDPATFDIDHRSHHVAFGFGYHQCLGQGLARMELQVALPALLRRFPDLRLAAPFDDLEFRHDMLIYGLESLPVEW